MGGVKGECGDAILENSGHSGNALAKKIDVSTCMALANVYLRVTLQVQRQRSLIVNEPRLFARLW